MSADETGFFGKANVPFFRALFIVTQLIFWLYVFVTLAPSPFFAHEDHRLYLVST